MKKIFSATLIALLLTGCLRGESRSLDEIYTTAKERYAQASKTGLPSDVSSSVDQIAKHLDSLVNGQDAAAINQITNSLTEILPRAGYTVRPALTEIRNQYAEISQGGAPSAQELKLLVARTYSLLSEELDAQRFGIEQ